MEEEPSATAESPFPRARAAVPNVPALFAGRFANGRVAWVRSSRTGATAGGFPHVRYQWGRIGRAFAAPPPIGGRARGSASSVRRHSTVLTRGRTANFPEGPLVVLVRVLLAGVLATPLVVWDELIYPYVLPKALYSRVLIALAFAVWAVLAAARPAWRPPRSALLLLVGVGAAVAVVATPFGVSPRYSVWSDYGRMEGLFDLAHWVAFAVVAASVLRTERDWWLMLNGFVAVGLLLAGHAIVQVLRAPGPLDPTMHVVGAMGNPAYLGAMLQAVALLAAGLLGASLVRRQRDRRTLTLLARAFPVVALVAAICGLLLSGSKGAFLGFFAGAAVGLFAFACAVGGPPARRLVLVAVAMLTAPPLLLGGAFAWRAASDEDSLADRVPLIWRATDPFELGLSVQSRLENWRAGAAAFAERPLLGWGPGNYMPAGAAHTSADAGRHLPNRGAINEAQDHAHNVLVEEAVTKGVPGVLAYLALWVWTGVVAWRALRAARGGDRILVAAVGAALAGWARTEPDAVLLRRCVAHPHAAARVPRQARDGADAGGRGPRRGCPAERLAPGDRRHGRRGAGGGKHRSKHGDVRRRCRAVPCRQGSSRGLHGEPESIDRRVRADGDPCAHAAAHERRLELAGATRARP